MIREFRIDHSITDRSSEGIDRYLSQVSKVPMISTEREEQLSFMMSKGGKEAVSARNEMVQANLRFVVSIAKRYQHQGMSLLDLIEEGNIGLIKAAEKFDSTRGFKFISYAVWWIRQSIMQALSEKNEAIRIPLNQNGLLMKISQARQDFVQKEHRQPSETELAEILNEKVEKIKAALDIQRHTTSLDKTVLEDSDTTMADMLSADTSTDPDRKLDQESLSHDVKNALQNVLNSKETSILVRSFGIGQHEESLDQIGESMGISRERVRQLREKSLLKLRAHHTSSVLQKYL